MTVEDSLGSVREMLGGLHQSGTALIRRGTAMGPLIPMVLLVPVLLGFAWLLRDMMMIGGVPLFSTGCMIGVVAIVSVFLGQYLSFARNDPDRLQSERYRIRMEQLEIQRIYGKEGALATEELEPARENPAALEGDADDRDDSETRK